LIIAITVKEKILFYIGYEPRYTAEWEFLFHIAAFPFARVFHFFQWKRRFASSF